MPCGYLVGHLADVGRPGIAVGGAPFFLLLAGRPRLRSDNGYLCLCGDGLPAVPFSATSKTCPGSRRSSPATRRLQAEAASAQTGSPRSAVLDCPPPAVGRLVRNPDHRQAGDRGFLASCRIPAVLAVAVSATSTGATTGEFADPPVNSTHEGGESHMGCASHSRRTAPARVRDFRAHGFALSSQPKRLSG